MTAQVTQVNLPHRQKELQELMKQITYSVSRIQTRFCAEFYLNKRLTKMQVSNLNNSIKYQTALGAIHVKSADCNNVVQRSLKLNLNIAWVIAGSQGTNSLIPSTRSVTMSKQLNVFLLKPPSKVSNFADLNITDNSSYVKQHSSKWHVLHNSAMVTGSTLGKAISLQTLKQQKEYYQVKFKNKKTSHQSRVKKNTWSWYRKWGTVFSLSLLISPHGYLIFFPWSNYCCTIFLKSEMFLLFILDPQNSDTHRCSHACFLAGLLQISRSWAQFHIRCWKGMTDRS